MGRLLIFLIIFISPILTYAQDALDIEVGRHHDTIPLGKKAFWYKPKIVLGIGGHNSLVGGEKVRMTGVRLGLEFNHTWRFGIGTNRLNPPIHRLGGDEQNPIFYRIDYGTANIFIEYIVLNNRRWEFSFPLEFGFGGTTISSRTDTNDFFVPDRGVVVRVRQLSAVGYYKVWKWLGIGASIGYRDVTAKSKIDPKLAEIVTKAFDGPNWAIKTKIYVGELWRLLFKKKKSKS